MQWRLAEIQLSFNPLKNDGFAPEEGLR